MAEEPKRPPSELVASIKRKAESVRQSADYLTKCIAHFESYLGTIPGRVETLAYGNHPDADQTDAELLHLALYYRRKGSDWSLGWASYHDVYNGRQGEPVDIKPLNEAPLRIKIAAVKMFPQVLVAIEKSQDTLFEDIVGAASEYINFASTLQMPGAVAKEFDVLKDFCDMAAIQIVAEDKDNAGILEAMKTHPALGRQVLESVRARRGRRANANPAPHNHQSYQRALTEAEVIQALSEAGFPQRKPEGKK